ncbi:TerB family tellurite resistance protein [Winogradskyella sp. DF17]|uniref:TerB family tellurite resistance protein n=1 Tax=Winogradskyella pelagia TaxID=2819984 RepID=A0ABS3SZQ2_9FLAO|nr:TerB family tellurite resistance protein [Winogradskyella sp. DF17]MBO3115962.1 TerB family tellurite resistance protein [Winogradskyella sp. DF17]
MQPQAIISATLSEQLGNLFYAIAKADGTLSIEEYISFSEILEGQWGAYGEKNIERIKKQFNKAQKEDLNSTDCFEAFSEYLSKNPNVFTKSLKTLIFETSNAIVYAFAKINKSELNFMARLSIAFKNADI